MRRWPSKDDRPRPERRERWGSRILDIDIVRYGDLVVDEPGLTIPHPGLKDRDFWQREIQEIEQRAGE
jgi:2-amino-4-hydroxy-6-hydroxymethyldihydropteridine diphosphokinase